MPDEPKMTPAPGGAMLVEPDFSLKKKMGDLKLEDVFNKERVDQAETVITRHVEEFHDLVRQDLENLRQTFAVLRRKMEDAQEANLMALSETAFSIKSRSGLHGYSFASDVAKSLMDLCDHIHQVNKPITQALDAHIRTLDLIFESNLQTHSTKTAQELLAELRRLSHLARQEFFSSHPPQNDS